MTDGQIAWVDVVHCTGCGACVEVCPTGAIALVEERARVDDESCSGCGTCVDVCPETAVQLVLQGELVPTPQQPLPTVHRPSPLAETAGAAVAVAGVSFLARAGRALAQATGRWLTRWLEGTSSLPRQAEETGVGAGSRSGGGAGMGRRTRHRRRGQ
jgi:formate hydrogenlyase subunit 6/NADH:ubiquinone oxidoreductase subunit I